MSSKRFFLLSQSTKTPMNNQIHIPYASMNNHFGFYEITRGSFLLKEHKGQRLYTIPYDPFVYMIHVSKSRSIFSILAHRRNLLIEEDIKAIKNKILRMKMIGMIPCPSCNVTYQLSNIFIQLKKTVLKNLNL